MPFNPDFDKQQGIIEEMRIDLCLELLQLFSLQGYFIQVIFPDIYGQPFAPIIKAHIQVIEFIP